MVTNALNITGANVLSNGSGGFCFVNLPFTPHSIQVTVQLADPQVSASANLSPPCGGSAVFVYDQLTGLGNATTGFFVLFY